MAVRESWDGFAEKVCDTRLAMKGLWECEQAGHWFPEGLSERDFRGLFAYKVFLAMAIFLGDGMYNLVKVPSQARLPPLPIALLCFHW